MSFLKYKFKPITRRRQTQKTKIFRVVFCITCLCFLACGSERQISKNQLIEDMDFYAEAIHETHADPFRMIPEKDFKEKAKELKQRITASKKDKFTQPECFFYLQEMAALIQDDHTHITFPGKLKNDPDSTLPFVLKAINKEVFVIENMGKNRVPVFSQLLEINRTPVKKIFADCKKFFTTSLEHARWIQFEKFLVVYLPGYFDLQPPWSIKYRHDSQIKTAKVKAISLKNYYAYRKKRNRRYSVSYITVKGKKAPLLDLPSLAYGTEQEFHDFIDGFFAEHKDAAHLIIDMRRNRGGSGYWGFYMLSHLTDAPFRISKGFIFKVSDRMRKSGYAYKAEGLLDSAKNGEYLTAPAHEIWTPHKDSINFKGKVFLLVSHDTFSAAVVTAAAFKFNKMGLIIGQETAGREQFHSDPIFVELPHSKLRATIPLAIMKLPGNNPDRGVIPDFKITYSIEDYQNQKDKELEKVRELIRQDLGTTGREKPGNR